MTILNVLLILSILSESNFVEEDPYLVKLLTELDLLIKEDEKKQGFPVCPELLNTISEKTKAKLEEIDNYCNKKHGFSFLVVN